jgi:hypothetical protein
MRVPSSRCIGLLFVPFVSACAIEQTDIMVSVYSALSFASDSAIRGVCLESTSRGMPTKRVLATALPGVPPRKLFDFRVVPLDENLSNPITLTVTARTVPTCSTGVVVARVSRVVRFVPGERVRESFVLESDTPPPPTPPDAGVDVPLPRPDVPDACGCPAGLLCCGARCIDPRYDPRNCGACGQVCHESSVCNNGACLCPTGQMFCTNRCTDLRNDPDHCDGCNQRCLAPANGMRGCQNGDCIYTCNEGYVAAAGACTHCGLAGEPACNTRMPCAAGLTLCSGFCRNGLCS